MLRVQPADQRLDAGEFLGLGVDLGLELEHQLVVLDGAPQLAGERELAHAVGIRFGAVHDEAELIALGRIHRHVGMLQQLGGGRAVLGIERHPDADPDLQRQILNGERPPQHFDEALGRPTGHFKVGRPEQQDGELVAAQAGDRVGAA